MISLRNLAPLAVSGSVLVEVHHPWIGAGSRSAMAPLPLPHEAGAQLCQAVSGARKCGWSRNSTTSRMASHERCDVA